MTISTKKKVRGKRHPIRHPIKSYQEIKRKSEGAVQAHAKFIMENERKYDRESSKRANNSLRLVIIILLLMAVSLCFFKLISWL